MKPLLITLLLTLTSCATRYRQVEVEPQPKSYLEIRQQKILDCTQEFLRQGVDFEVAVRGCKDDIYFK